MANQSNYVEQIPANPQVFAVSRIAESGNDFDILDGRLPGEFGFDTEDNIEMHFYDGTNKLVASVIVPVSSGIVSARTIMLPDGTKDEKVIVDMTRVQKELGLIIAPGTYNVTMNFFSNEIGSYTNPKMAIEEVSPSRTELRLGYTNTFTDVEQSELFEFTQPSIPRVLAAGVVYDYVGLGQNEQQVQTFVNNVLNILITDNPNLIADLTNLNPVAPDNLNLTIETISGAIYDEFVSLLDATISSRKFNRLQANELVVLIQTAIDNAIKNNNINLYTKNDITYVVKQSTV